MALTKLVEALAPLLASPLITGIATAFVGSAVAIITYRFQTVERLHGTITWQWRMSYDGDMDEHPFLTIHNRSNSAAYLKSARYLSGNFFRMEARRYAFNYFEVTDGSFPMKIKKGAVRDFPLSKEEADKLVNAANVFNRVIGYILKRPFLWIEVETVGNKRLIVPANDATDFQNRPRWIDLRWLPTRKPDWASNP